MFGPIDASEARRLGIVVRPAKSTEYVQLSKDASQTIGVSHHKTGLGKLKVVDGGVEYGVPITDILDKPLSEWRIETKG